MVFVAVIAFSTASQGQSASGAVGDDTQPVVTVRAEFVVNEESRTGELAVTAAVRGGYHIYAMTQSKPFLATKISVEPSDK